ncbi:hypothetical protein [Nonomuraea sp. NPDC005692]|uniref:hypothetical protein n=1 Tax=Nonomuraea sp. NPDC005692 TaxID=3157168 RepID=UPI0033CD269F
MTQPPDEYGDVLRRALRAEADAVVPSPEGLQIIRARIERRGVRNLFWWRAGAAAVSAVLVAGTIVMVVPGLRSQIFETPVKVVDNSTTTPGNSSTRLSTPPRPDSHSAEPPPVVVVPPSHSETHRPAETARSTRQPTPSPTPSSTPCPSGEPAGDQECPEITPTPTPTPTETTDAPTSCPSEECPPDDMPTGPSDLSSPLVDVPHTTP